MKTPKPGSFGLSKIPGIKGKLVWLGQAISGDTSEWTHAWFILDNGECIEAMPGGARIMPLADRLKHEEVLISDKPVKDFLKASPGVHEGQLRQQLSDYARALDGVPYNWTNYISLGFLALHIKPRRLREYVANNKQLICSQLVDFVYAMNGIHLFNDGRVPMDSSPGDLFKYIKGKV